jgi:hypothetical protein
VLPHPSDQPPADSPDRQARLDALLQRLRPALEQAALDMAGELLDLPEEELFGRIEFALRDRAHRLATDVHQAGLDCRQKKTATTAPASSAPGVARTPSSTTTSTARS